MNIYLLSLYYVRLSTDLRLSTENSEYLPSNPGESNLSVT
ncbi:hypothetical protein PT2222_140161 [Paraburkholderia tropica]